MCDCDLNPVGCFTYQKVEGKGIIIRDDLVLLMSGIDLRVWPDFNLGRKQQLVHAFLHRLFPL